MLVEWKGSSVTTSLGAALGLDSPTQRERLYHGTLKVLLPPASLSLTFVTRTRVVCLCRRWLPGMCLGRDATGRWWRSRMMSSTSGSRLRSRSYTRSDPSRPACAFAGTPAAKPQHDRCSRRAKDASPPSTVRSLIRCTCRQAQIPSVSNFDRRLRAPTSRAPFPLRRAHACRARSRLSRSGSAPLAATE